MGARIRLAPQKDWKPTSLPNWQRCSKPSKVFRRRSTARASGGKKVSLADLIVLGGSAAVERARKRAGTT